MNAGPSKSDASNAPSSHDWTTGAAKWFAVLVLGAASIAGMLWSINTRKLASWAREPAPQIIEIHPNSPRGTAPAALTTPAQQPAAKNSDTKAYPREKLSADDTPATTPTAAPASAATSSATTTDSPEKAAVPAKLDLNTATVAQLELLPGIGPAIAQRIVEYRQQHGKFATLESLDAVKGIGPKIIARLRPLVTW